MYDTLLVSIYTYGVSRESRFVYAIMVHVCVKSGG